MKKDKCFECAVAVTLNHAESKNNLQRITKIKPLINKYNWEEKSFLLE